MSEHSMTVETSEGPKTASGCMVWIVTGMVPPSGFQKFVESSRVARCKAPASDVIKAILSGGKAVSPALWSEPDFLARISAHIPNL